MHQNDKKKSYLEYLELLDPNNSLETGLVAIDLFAGTGGLALGFEAAGIQTIGYEKDPDAVATYNKNLHGDCFEIFLDKSVSYPEADIVIGGPPCQPFSVGGKQMGLRDSRDGFPAFVHAIETVKPKIWMFENVRGMLYRNKQYLREISDSLENLGYSIDIKILKAVEYNVPQNRERLIVVGHKGGYNFPAPFTHKFTAGDAVADIAYELREDDEFLTPNQDAYIAKYEKASNCINPRDLHFNRPARTVTCRNLAGATGDMHRIKLADGRRKRVNVREAARLQSFPDWFEFEGSKNSQFYQIGNAVPPLMSYFLGLSFRDYLEGTNYSYKPEMQLQLL
jgi:DNA (cytosine-5)-methyltransferase 1